MWSQYDEDLSQNNFFKEIKQNHQDILKKSSEEKWIICIPRSGSQKIKDITVNAILDHVLLSENDGSFSTLSKKKIILKDHYLKWDDIFNTDVEVLFEETHYLEETRKYTIWCIEKPLFVTQDLVDSSDDNVILCSIQDCIDFLYTESFGYNILEEIQKLSFKFWENHEGTFEVESLQSQKDFIGNLFSQCLQVCFRSEILQDKCNKNILYFENLKLSVETYMQYCLGKKLMYSVNSLQHLKDSMLNKFIRNSLNISLGDLSISNKFEDLILHARYEISRINHYLTVLDKLNCLTRTFNIFNRHVHLQDQSLILTSDDFLQIFVYLILKCNVSNWVANLTYLKEFNFMSLESCSQYSFLIATLEGAIEFIKSNQLMDIKKSYHSSCLNKEGSLKQNNSVFYGTFNKLMDGKSEEDLNRFINTSFTDVIEKNVLCHPLCFCEKCQQIISKKSHQKPYEITNEFDQNFLILACIENNIILLEFLLTLDFKINFKDIYGKTALHYAAEKGFQNILMLLLNLETDVNVVDNDKNTPLHLACDRGHESCVKALIYSSHFVELNLQNFSGETPLFLATKWGYFDIVKILLENGASVCIKNNRNMGVYKLAPNFFIADLFRQFGAIKSSIILKEVINNDNNNSSQHIPNISESVNIFLNKRQDRLYGVKPKNNDEAKIINLLLKAIENNDFPLACFYLGYNNSFVEFDKVINLEDRCHPLCSCEQCLKGDNGYFLDDENYKKMILKDKMNCRFNINICNDEGYTPLHIAAKFGRTDILRILLDSGAIPNVCMYQTLYTPLHLACMFDRILSVKELLKCGDSKIDMLDFKGNTPLYYASVQNNSLKLVEILLQNGADCQRKNYEGKSIIQECEEKNLFRVCKMFKENIGGFFKNSKDIVNVNLQSNNADETGNNFAFF